MYSSVTLSYTEGLQQHVQKLVIRNHQFMIAQRLVVRQCCGCFSTISCTELSWVGGQAVFMQLQNHVWSFGLLGCDPWVYCELSWYALWFLIMIFTVCSRLKFSVWLTNISGDTVWQCAGFSENRIIDTDLLLSSWKFQFCCASWWCIES